MEFKIIDKENKIVKIECTTQDYLNGSLDKYIDTGIRTIANKIVIEIDNTKG